MLDPMPSHSVGRVVSLQPMSADPTRVTATVVLQCGCQVTREIAADRVVPRPGGEPFVVGKVPCPQGHPVRPPAASSS